MKKEKFQYLVILIFSLLFFFSGEIKAQNSKEERVLVNQIGLSLGFNQGLVKDLNFSALNYDESGLLYSLDYVRNQPNGKGFLTLDIDFGLGGVQTPVSDFFAGENTLLNFEFSYMRTANVKNARWETYLGGQYNSFFQILDWDDLESFSFLATHGIGFKALTTFKLNDKSWLQTSIFVPIIQNLVRPPYNGVDEKIIENQDKPLKLLLTGKPASWNKYFAFDWKFNYTLILTRKLNFNVAYLLRYQNVYEINKFIQVQNQITTGLSLKF